MNKEIKEERKLQKGKQQAKFKGAFCSFCYHEQSGQNTILFNLKMEYVPKEHNITIQYTVFPRISAHALISASPE